MHFTLSARFFFENTSEQKQKFSTQLDAMVSHFNRSSLSDAFIHSLKWCFVLDLTSRSGEK